MPKFKLPKARRAAHGSKLPHRQRLYYVWANMLRRCGDPDNPAFRRYGGRGILVVSPFDDFAQFYDWGIKAGYRPGLQLDRENNDGPYSPGNCRWVSGLINAQNRANNVRLADGRAASSVCLDAGIPSATFHWRRYQGWSVEQACGVFPPPDASSISLPDGSRAVEFARSNGIPRNTFYSRVAAGWSPADAAARPVGDARLRLASGITVSEAARSSGLPRNLPYRRIAAGWSPDDAVSIPKGGKRPAASAPSRKGKF